MHTVFVIYVKIIKLLFSPGLLEADVETDEFMETMTNPQPSSQCQHINTVLSLVINCLLIAFRIIWNAKL